MSGEAKDRLKDFLEKRAAKVLRAPFPQEEERQLRRPEINLSHGAVWNALISKYIGTIPLSGDPRCAAVQSHCGWPLVAVMSAMTAKVGAAARLSQSAAARATAAPSSRPAAGRVGVVSLAHGFAAASRFRKAASPASDTLTHCGSGAASAS